MNEQEKKLRDQVAVVKDILSKSELLSVEVYDLLQDLVESAVEVLNKLSDGMS